MQMLRCRLCTCMHAGCAHTDALHASAGRRMSAYHTRAHTKVDTHTHTHTHTHTPSCRPTCPAALHARQPDGGTVNDIPHTVLASVFNAFETKSRSSSGTWSEMQDSLQSQRSTLLSASAAVGSDAGDVLKAFADLTPDNWRAALTLLTDAGVIRWPKVYEYPSCPQCGLVHRLSSTGDFRMPTETGHSMLEWTARQRAAGATRAGALSSIWVLRPTPGMFFSRPITLVRLPITNYCNYRDFNTDVSFIIYYAA
jgi:hypothetical protein